MKHKENKSTKDIIKTSKYDLCQSPPYAIYPLIKYLPKDSIIWESAAGEKSLVTEMTNSGYTVVNSDIQTGYNFFEWQPDEWDIQVTNPPYSIKYLWIKRSYELHKPFALLLPLECLGAKSAQKYFKHYGMELIVLDKRINFKMPNKGYEGGGAQFPVAWFTYGLNLGQAIIYEKLNIHAHLYEVKELL